MESPRLQIRRASLTRWTFSDIVLSERKRRSRATKEDAMKKPVIGVVPLWDDEKNSIWMLPNYLDGLLAAGAAPGVRCRRSISLNSSKRVMICAAAAGSPAPGT